MLVVGVVLGRLFVVSGVDGVVEGALLLELDELDDLRLVVDVLCDVVEDRFDVVDV